MATLSSDPSASQAITPSPTTWWLKVPTDSSKNTTIRASSWDPRAVRPVAVHAPSGRTRHVVLRGPRLGVQGTLGLYTQSEAEFDKVEAALDSGRTLLLQSVLGDQWYVEVTADVSRTQQRAGKVPSEAFPVRHFHQWSVPLTEVEAPA